MAAATSYRAETVAAAGTWPAAQAVGTVTLAYADRHIRRRRLVSDNGLAVLVALPRARRLHAGDGLGCADGTWFAVAAAAEPLLAVRAADARQLARLTWHVGNRHTPVAVGDLAFWVQADPVLETMLTGLGAEVTRCAAPFEPEPGAYAHGHGHARPGDGGAPA